MCEQKKIHEKVKSVENEIIKIRRHIHQHPEIGRKEFETSKFIVQYLEKLGLEVQSGLADTGVTAFLLGAKPGKTIALRADIDALPLAEKTGAPYQSINQGVMHGCGHDGHIAALLGAAAVLAGLKNQLVGNVKFIFQPAEEGPGGAEDMIKAGVLEGVDAIVGAHLWMDVPVGKVGINYGGAMACLDSISIKINGKGGHGSMPHQTVDAVVVASEVVHALQTIASREVSPVEPVVVSIGTIKGGHAYNIIAEEVEMQGTVRAIDPILRKSLPERIERIISGITAATRAQYDYTYHFGYPPLINDTNMTSLVEQTAQKVLGDNKVQIMPPTMAGEDMAYYLEKVPGTFFFVGIANPEKGIIYPHHNPKFDMDESALAIASEMLVSTALAYLQK